MHGNLNHENLELPIYDAWYKYDNTIQCEQNRVVILENWDTVEREMYHQYTLNTRARTHTLSFFLSYTHASMHYTPTDTIYSKSLKFSLFIHKKRRQCIMHPIIYFEFILDIFGCIFGTYWKPISWSIQYISLNMHIHFRVHFFRCINTCPLDYLSTWVSSTSLTWMLLLPWSICIS